VNLAFVRLQDFSEQNLATVLRLLESHFEMANVRVRTIQSSKRASRIIRGHLDSIVFTLLILAGAMLGVSTLGMMSAISTNVVERTRELAILRSIGGKPGAIRTIVTSEAVFMAAIAWLLALVLSAFVGPLLSAYFGEALVEYPFDFRFSLQGIALSLGIAMLLAAVACVTPVRAINRRAVSTALQESD
jgi:ABC-type antimicrobial peptide transport system permease subunit